MKDDREIPKKGPKYKVTMSKFITAAKDSAGVISVIAERLQVSRQHLSQWIHGRPDAEAVLEDENERMVDLAESKLVKVLNKDEHKDHWKGVEFTLKTKGKGRGYVSKQIVEEESKQPDLLITEKGSIIYGMMTPAQRKAYFKKIRGEKEK